MPKLISRKDAVVDTEVDRIDWNLNRHNVTYLHGTARVLDGHTVELTEAGEAQKLTAEIILVATGSVPFQPASIPFEDPDIDDSDTILQLDRLPKTMTVIGGASSAASTRRCSARSGSR